MKKIIITAIFMLFSFSLYAMPVDMGKSNFQVELKSSSEYQVHSLYAQVPPPAPEKKGKEKPKPEPKKKKKPAPKPEPEPDPKKKSHR